MIDEFLKSKTKYSIYFNQNIDKPPKLPSLLSIPYIWTTFWNSVGKRAAQACSKFNQFSNKGILNEGIKIDNKDIMKLFFTFLHQKKNISNIKVLKAFYSNEELKEL